MKKDDLESLQKKVDTMQQNMDKLMHMIKKMQLKFSVMNSELITLKSKSYDKPRK